MSITAKTITARTIQARNITASNIGGNSGGETEYYRYFFGLDGDSEILFTPINISSNDFEYETYLITNNLKSHILSNSTGVHRIFIDSTAKKLEISGAGGTVTFTPLAITVGVPYKINIVKSGTLYSYYVDDVLIDTATAGGTSLIFDCIGGVRGTGTTVPAFSGNQWNTKLWVNGDSSSGTLVYSAFINDNDTTIIDTASGNHGALTEGTGAWLLVSTTDPDSLDPNVWNGGSGWITSGGGGLPDGIITYDGEPLTFEGEYVTYGV